MTEPAATATGLRLPPRRRPGPVAEPRRVVHINRGDAMGVVYDRAAALDKPVADRWKARTGENLDRQLTPADVNFIVAPVFRGRLTERQGEALAEILENSKFTPAGLVRLRQIVTQAADADNLNLVPLFSETDLLPYMTALGQDVVGRIVFKSPGTGITYAPFDYQVVRDLIQSGRVPVFEARAGYLSTAQRDAAAKYDTTAERIVMYEFNLSNRLARTMTIVHEVTHVIQDWRDLPSLIHHEETDAYIAEAVVEETLRNTVMGIDDDPVTVAAQRVMRRQTAESDPGWVAAYNRAVDDVAQRVKKPGMRSTVETPNRRQNALYEQLLTAVRTSEMMRESVRRSADEWKKTAQGVKIPQPVR